MAGQRAILQKQSASLQAVNSAGSILIIALWSLCLLATFAITLGYGVRQKLTLMHRLQERRKLHFIAEAGIKKAIAQLKKAYAETTGKALGESLSNNPGAFKDINVGDGIVNISYNYNDEQAQVQEERYGFIDEERKLNINKLDIAVLKRLLQVVAGLKEAEAQELSASIVDWRDSDSELSVPLGSAEDYYYRGLQHPYEAKDAEFEVLEELLLVKDMNADIFEKLKDYITIYGIGKVNINTASRVALLALGLNEQMADRIIAFRAGTDGVTCTTDDNIFDSADDITPRLSEVYRLNESETGQLSQVQEQYLSVDSENFMIRSIARLQKKKSGLSAICVADKAGRIIHWQEF